MRWTLGGFVAAFLLGAPVVAAEGLEAQLLSERQFFYEGEAVVVRLSLHNNGAARLNVEKDVAEGIEVRTADGQTRPTGGVTGTAAPRTLEPGARHELEIDLAAVEALRHAGLYRIGWRSRAGAADAIEIRVIERYDPLATHVARIRTTAGEIELRLSPEISPLAVKVFVDLARAGFYDGTRVQRVYAGSHVVAGESGASAAPGSSLSFPGEQSETPVLAGTVILEPLGAAPPANGTTFIIALRPQPAWTAQVTVLGQVVHGLDVVERISHVPTGAEDAARPLEPVEILKLSISAEAAVPPRS